MMGLRRLAEGMRQAVEYQVSWSPRTSVMRFRWSVLLELLANSGGCMRLVTTIGEPNKTHTERVKKARAVEPWCELTREWSWMDCYGGEEGAPSYNHPNSIFNRPNEERSFCTTQRINLHAGVSTG